MPSSHLVKTPIPLSHVGPEIWFGNHWEDDLHNFDQDDHKTGPEPATRPHGGRQLGRDASIRIELSTRIEMSLARNERMSHTITFYYCRSIRFIVFSFFLLLKRFKNLKHNKKLNYILCYICESPSKSDYYAINISFFCFHFIKVKAITSFLNLNYFLRINTHTNVFNTKIVANIPNP